MVIILNCALRGFLKSFGWWRGKQLARALVRNSYGARDLSRIRPAANEAACWATGCHGALVDSRADFRLNGWTFGASWLPQPIALFRGVPYLDFMVWIRPAGYQLRRCALSRAVLLDANP